MGSAKHITFLFKHSGIYALGNIFAQVAGFLLLPLYTNYLTPTDYGIAALVETTISIVGVMASMGIGYSLARFHSRENSEADKNLVISTAYVIAIGVCLAAIPALYLFSGPLSELIFSHSKYSVFFLLSGSALFVGVNFDIGLTYLNLKEKSVAYVVLSFSNTLALIALNIYFIAFLEVGLVGIFYSSIIVKCVFASFLTIIILLRVKLRFSCRVGLQMVRFSAPLGMSAACRVVSQQSDKLLINFFFSPLETGIYAVAGKIANGVHVLITTTFLRSYQPIRFEINKDENGPRIYGSIFEHYLILIGSFALFIAMYSTELIELMTSKDFYTAARYIPPLILSWIFFGMKYHLENGILISMRTKYVTYIAAGTSFVNILLNIILIPMMGVWGAVIAVNISNMLLACASYYYSQKFYPVSIKWRAVSKYALCLVSFCLLGVSANSLALVPAITLKACLFVAYCVTVLSLGLLETDCFIKRNKNTRGLVH